MGIWIQISSSGAPIYAQIVAQVESAVARGELRPGDKIPPVRKLAEELVVNPNTVAKAYRQMEQMGLVETRKGAGTFILDPKQRTVGTRDLQQLAEQIDTVIEGRCPMSNIEPASRTLENEHQQLERQMDRTVDRAVGSGVNVELLWSVFETRLRRAIKRGDGR
jgi:GntR family transcriptional regulator